LRDEGIDIFKGILIILMILAHVIQFFGSNSTVLSWLSVYVNLTTFSGFYFAFGYSSEIAYFSKEYSNVKKRMLITALKLLLAFLYIWYFV
jgi:fucose 4-O-acetylase-like acetyltransferase